MNKNSKILITGSGGMVGKNLINELRNQRYKNLILTNYNNLNLCNRDKVFDFFKKNKPEYVFHTASKVGGINDNLERPVEFLRENLLINTNVIDACFKEKIKKLIILNSATIYPTNLEYPNEKNLFEGHLEKENEAYALSKFYAIKLCEYYNKEYGTNFINLASTNIYGRYSKFDSEKSNVIAALIKRFHDSKVENKKEVTVWGSGNAKRELINAKDLSRLIILVMEKITEKNTEKGLLNCGFNDEFSIKDIAEKIKKITGFTGKLIFDKTKPEGIKRRVMNSEKFQKLIKLQNRTPIEEGLKEMYKYYLKKVN